MPSPFSSPSASREAIAAAAKRQRLQDLAFASSMRSARPAWAWKVQELVDVTTPATPRRAPLAKPVKIPPASPLSQNRQILYFVKTPGPRSARH